MDTNALQDKLRDVMDRLPQDRGDRIKLVLVVTLLPILLLWLAYYSIVTLWPAPVATELNSTAWVTAREITEKLNAERAFQDVGLSVESERPLKFVVRGAVHADRDLVTLDQKLKELRPEGDYEVKVEVLKVTPP